MRCVILALSAALACAAAAKAAEPAVNSELIRLHDDLRLAPAQEGAWMDYARAIAPGRDLEARHRAADQMLPGLSTPRRIALIAATMAADEADFRKMGAAVDAFYAGLTAEQQRTFDAETVPSGGRASGLRVPD